MKEDDNGAHRGHRDDIGDAEIGRVDWKGDDAWNVEDGCDQVDGNQKLKITNMLEVGANWEWPSWHTYHGGEY